jgi:hypothetical protein
VVPLSFVAASIRVWDRSPTQRHSIWIDVPGVNSTIVWSLQPANKLQLEILNDFFQLP